MVAKQTDRRDAWSSSGQEASQRPRDPAGARWLQVQGATSAGVPAGLPADIPFTFRHWSTGADDAWHQYMLQYRTEYTYRRLLAVQRGPTHAPGTATVDSRGSTRLRDASAPRYSADNVTAGGGPSCPRTVQSDTAAAGGVKTVHGRAGHRSAPASIVHADHNTQLHHHHHQQQQRRVIQRDEDNVSITTLSLQLPSADPYQQPQPASKSFLRCPAISIQLNAAETPPAGPSSLVPVTSAGSILPRVTTVIESASVPGSESNVQQSAATVGGAPACDSQPSSLLNGRTMRAVPANGFSIDDRTVSVVSFVGLCLS